MTIEGAQGEGEAPRAGSLPLHDVQLVGVIVTEISLKRFPVLVTNNAKHPLTIDTQVAAVSQSDTEHQIHLDISIDSTEEEKPFSLFISMLGQVRSDREVMPEDFAKFADRSGYLLLWPYARELVSDLTVRCGLPPLILPTLAVTQEVRESEDREGLVKAEPISKD